MAQKCLMLMQGTGLSLLGWTCWSWCFEYWKASLYRKLSYSQKLFKKKFNYRFTLTLRIEYKTYWSVSCRTEISWALALSIFLDHYILAILVDGTATAKFLSSSHLRHEQIEAGVLDECISQEVSVSLITAKPKHGAVYNIIMIFLHYSQHLYWYLLYSCLTVAVHNCFL